MTADRKKQLIKSGMIILVATFFGRLFGFVREVFISAQYGTTAQAEAYFIAITIPTIMIAVLPGALNSVCTPLFAEYKAKEDYQGLQKLFNTVTSLVLLGSFALSIAGGLFATHIVSVLAPGFTGETRELTIRLVELIIPSITIIGLISVFWSYLNAQQHFLMPSLGPLVASIIVIISIFALVPQYGIYGLTVGTVIGFIFQALIMYPTLSKQELKFGLGFDLSNPAVKRFLILMIPIVLGMSINQLNVVVDRILGSGLAEGKLAAYVYATRIYQLPIGIFVGAITLPLFPVLSQYASSQNISKLIDTMWIGLKMLALVMLPVTAILIVLGEPIVRILFERGEFNRISTMESYWALIFLAMGLFPYAARDLFTRVFYAVQDTRTPVIINTVTIILNIILSILLVKTLEQGGLGLGMALAGAANFVIMLYFIRLRIGVAIDKQALIQIIKIFFATLVMILAMVLTKNYFQARPGLTNFVNEETVAQELVLLTTIIISSGIVYVLALWLMRVNWPFGNAKK